MISTTQFISSHRAMESFGAKLARIVFKPCVIHLSGDLGTGKTTLVRGFLHALGHQGIVKSPTYTLVEIYQCGDDTIYHFDLYRLSHPEELDYLGIRDYLEQSICLIEWPEKGGQLTPPADLLIRFFHRDHGRSVELIAHNPNLSALL